MPTSTDARNAAVGQAGGLQTYATFRLRDGLFGLATDVVKEVTVLPPLTPIPHAPLAIRGYVNLRGHIVLVVDLNCLLRREPTPLNADNHLLVFKLELGDAFGVLAERIGEIVELSSEQIQTHHSSQVSGGSEHNDWPEGELICGVGQLAGELVSLLDARELLPCLARAIARPRSAPVKEISL